MEPTKRSLGLTMTFMFLGGFVWMLATASTNPNPSDVVVPTPVAFDTIVNDGRVEITGLGWLGGCPEKAQSLVGIFTPGQPACDPGVAHGAGWLQTQLLGIGLLERVEYLEAIAEEGRCQVAVYNAIDRMPTGLICIETEGSLYRLTPGVDGRLQASDPWQLEADGTWGPINNTAIAIAES